jgi:pyrimidine deaminase RibD-like protein
MCADPAAAFGKSLPMVQAALAAHVGRVIGFLDDPDPGVAAAAAYALVQCATQPVARTALAEHPDQVVAAMRGPGEGFIHLATAQRLAEFVP